MNKIDTSQRTDKTEIMDDFELKGDALERTLKDLEHINNWLGGNKITMGGIKNLLDKHPPGKLVHIVDVGCGNGSILREIAQWGRKRSLPLKLTGIDANTHAIAIAERLSVSIPELSYAAKNIFDDSFRNEQYDIILCTLTLHHFKDVEIEEIMKSFYRQARIGIVINDLHRSKQAYYLFKAFCMVFIRNKIAREDGLTSILRGFKRKDIERYATGLDAKQQEIKWKWAYRYLWIIGKEN